MGWGTALETDFTLTSRGNYFLSRGPQCRAFVCREFFCGLLEAEEMLTEQFCPPQQTAKGPSLDRLPAGHGGGGVGGGRGGGMVADPAGVAGCLQDNWEGLLGPAPLPACSGRTGGTGARGWAGEPWEEVQARGTPGSGWLVLRISPTSLVFLLPQRRTGDAT